MFTHCVFFWLKPEVGEAERAEFAGELRALAGLPGVVSATAGTPAATEHQAVDRSYSFGFTVVCRDAAGYQEYAGHPLRRAFLDRWVKWFAKAVVYDFEG